jgi:AcrR family transcriptional regulator
MARARASVGIRAASAESGASARREKLLEVALDLFGRYGVKRTSIDTLAAAAGIAKGSVYLEWRSKDELFRAVAEYLTQGILGEATAQNAGNGDVALEERVTSVLMAKFWRLYELVHSRPHAGELIAAKDELAREVFREADDRFAEVVEETLASAKEWAPAARYGVREVAAVLLRAAHGNGYAARGKALGKAAYRRRLQSAVEIVLAGAKREPKRKR